MPSLADGQPQRSCWVRPIPKTPRILQWETAWRAPPRPGQSSPGIVFAGENLFLPLLLPSSVLTQGQSYIVLQVLHAFLPSLPFILHIISPKPLSWLILSWHLLPRVAEITKWLPGTEGGGGMKAFWGVMRKCSLPSTVWWLHGYIHLPKLIEMYT